PQTASAQAQQQEEQKTEPPAPPPPPPPPPPAKFPSTGPGGNAILVGPDTYLRIGVFAQAWANYLQSAIRVIDSTNGQAQDGGYAIDLYLRRVRFFAFVQFFKNFNMFILFDSPNMGRGAAPLLADGNLSKTFTPVNPPGNLIGDAFA